MHALLVGFLLAAPTQACPEDLNDRAWQAFSNQDHTASERHWREAAEVLKGDSANRKDYCKYFGLVGFALFCQNREPAAEQPMREAYAVACRLGDPQLEYQHCHNLASVLKLTGRFEESELLYRKCWRMAKAHPGVSPDRPDLLQGIRDLYTEAGRYDDAIKCANRLLAIADDNDPVRCAARQYSALATLYMEKEDYQESERYRALVFGPGKPRPPASYSIARVRFSEGRTDDALTAITEFVKNLSSDDSCNNLMILSKSRVFRAQLLLKLGRPDEALAEIRTALAVPEDRLAPGHPHRADALDIYLQLVPTDTEAARRRDHIRKTLADMKLEGIDAFRDDD